MATLSLQSTVIEHEGLSCELTLSLGSLPPSFSFPIFTTASLTLGNGSRSFAITPIGQPHWAFEGSTLLWICRYRIPTPSRVLSTESSGWTLTWTNALAADLSGNSTPTTGTAIPITSLSRVNSSGQTVWGTPTAEYFVRTTGNDSNNGSTGAPWATLDKARSVLEASHIGQFVIVNIGAGTYSGASAYCFFTSGTRGGLSKSAPWLFRAETAATPPLLSHSTAAPGGRVGMVYQGPACILNNVCFQNLRVQTTGAGSGEHIFTLNGPSSGGLAFEGIVVENCSREVWTAECLAGTTNGLNGVHWYRCLVKRSAGERASGIYGWRCTNYRIVECIFHECGYLSSTAGSDKGHSTYFHAATQNGRVIRTISLKSGGNGFSHNHSCIFEECYAGGYGYTGFQLRAHGRSGICSSVADLPRGAFNVVAQASAFVAGGLPIDINEVWPNPDNDEPSWSAWADGPCTISRFLSSGPATVPDLGGGNTVDDIEPPTVIIRTGTANRRILLDHVYSHNQGWGLIHVLDNGAAESALPILCLRDVYLHESGSASGPRYALRFDRPTIPYTRIIATNGRYISIGVSPNALMRASGGASSITFATWQANAEASASTTPLSLLDPTRTGATYNSSVLSGAATLNALCTSALAQTWNSWSALIDGRAISDWILAGYEPVSAENLPPTAVAGSDQTVTDTNRDGLSAFTLDFTASSDPESSTLTYRLLEGTTLLSTSAAPTLNLPLGTHNLLLEVRDGGGLTSTDPILLTAKPNIPLLSTTIDSPGHVTLQLASYPNVTLFRLQWGTVSGISSSSDEEPSYPNEIVSANPSFTLAGSGDIYFRFRAEASGTVSDWSDEQTYSIEPPLDEPPIAVIAGSAQSSTDTDRNGEETHTFLSTGSLDPEGGPLTYQWFEEGSPVSTASTLVRDFPIGAHSVALFTYDQNLNQSNLAVKSLEVFPNTPAGVQASPIIEGFILQCSKYTNAVAYDLQYDDDPSFTTPTTVRVLHDDETEGWVPSLATGSLAPSTTYHCRIRVIGQLDLAGAWSPSQSVTTLAQPANQPPLADAGPDAVHVAVSGSATFSLEGTASDPDGTISLIEWLLNSVVVSTGSLTPSQTKGLGAYAYTLRITDNDGTITTDTVTHTVISSGPTNTAPTANAGPNQTILANESGSASVQLNGTLSSDAEGPILAYAWEEGSDLLSTDPTPTLTLSASGSSYMITLTVTDEGGLTDSDEVIITILPFNAPSTFGGAGGLNSPPSNSTLTPGKGADKMVPRVTQG